MGRVYSPLLVPICFLAGCAFHTSSNIPAAASKGSAIEGKIYGGQQPVVGARLYVLAAGTNGYGQASNSLLTTGISGTDSIGGYVLSGVGGIFSVTGDYLCTPGTQVYILALGGDSGSGQNSAIGLMAALGTCPAAETLAGSVPFLIINEVTTVAAAYSIAGFATDSTHVSRSASVQGSTGIQNAFITASNLADLPSGSALATTPSGLGTVPQAKLNTLADILASCINSTSGAVGCNSLLSNALSGGTSGAAPVETATAMINIAHNSGANVGNLFALVTANPPFQPSLTTVPNDFTLVIAYANIGGGSISIDSSGAVWACYAGVGGASKNFLTQVTFSPQLTALHKGELLMSVRPPRLLQMIQLGASVMVPANPPPEFRY